MEFFTGDNTEAFNHEERVHGGHDRKSANYAKTLDPFTHMYMFDIGVHGGHDRE